MLYVDKINKFFNRAFRYGYAQNKCSIAKIIGGMGRALFSRIMNDSDHCLYELLPEKRQRPLRERDHQFIS